MRYVRRLKLLEPFTFFIDECLGRKTIWRALNAPNVLQSGERLSMLPQGTLDPKWIPLASAERWVCLTKDRQLRYRPNELEAILAAEIAVLVVGDASGAEMASRIVTALPTVRRVLRVRGLPLIARIEPDRLVTVLYEDGKKLKSPRRVEG